MTENLEEVKFDFSTKDIPIPPNFTYQKQMTRAVERLLKKLGWFVWFELNPDERPKKNTFGLKSHAAPPPEAIKVLDGFAKDLFHMVRNLKFKDKVRNEFPQIIWKM